MQPYHVDQDSTPGNHGDTVGFSPAYTGCWWEILKAEQKIKSFPVSRPGEGKLSAWIFQGNKSLGLLG